MTTRDDLRESARLFVGVCLTEGAEQGWREFQHKVFQELAMLPAWRANLVAEVVGLDVDFGEFVRLSPREMAIIPRDSAHQLR